MRKQPPYPDRVGNAHPAGRVTFRHGEHPTGR